MWFTNNVIVTLMNIGKKRSYIILMNNMIQNICIYNIMCLQHIEGFKYNIIQGAGKCIYKSWCEIEMINDIYELNQTGFNH